MIRLLALAALALAMTACGPQAPAPPAADGALTAPQVSGRLYICDLTYVAVRGPLVSTSRALVRMGVDTSAFTPGWKVESVTVTEPLPNAEGFDPWLSFAPGIARKFFEQRGAVITLAMADGAPVTLDTRTGDLNWSVEGALGETEFTGGCI